MLNHSGQSAVGISPVCRLLFTVCMCEHFIPKYFSISCWDLQYTSIGFGANFAVSFFGCGELVIGCNLLCREPRGLCRHQRCERPRVSLHPTEHIGLCSCVSVKYILIQCTPHSRQMHLATLDCLHKAVDCLHKAVCSGNKHRGKGLRATR